jgi:hypothetical protein
MSLRGATNHDKSDAAVLACRDRFVLLVLAMTIETHEELLIENC